MLGLAGGGKASRVLDPNILQNGRRAASSSTRPCHSGRQTSVPEAVANPVEHPRGHPRQIRQSVDGKFAGHDLADAPRLPP